MNCQYVWAGRVDLGYIIQQVFPQPAEKDLGVMVDEKISMSWQCVVAA